MNKISFIIEFDEVSKTQEEQLAEFIEKTGIKFHVLENDNDLKKYEKYKEVIDKITDLIKQYGKYDGEKCTRCFQMWSADFNKILDILKEVSECNK